MRVTIAMLLGFLAFAATFAPAQADALVVKASPHDVATTLDRLTKVLESKGITVFARIDHAAGAAKVEAELRPTSVLIFGNPKLGTPLMQSNQLIGLDLPLKALAWQDGDGKVWLAYTNAGELKARYAINDRDKLFQTMAGALDGLTNAALAAN